MKTCSIVFYDYDTKYVNLSIRLIPKKMKTKKNYLEISIQESGMKILIPKFLFFLFLFALCLLTTANSFSQTETITVDSIIQTSPCAGSNIYIPYTVSGGNFNFGNVFTAQLSDPNGSFSNPVNIGSTPYWSSGMIIGTIPLSFTIGFFYKVRIVASSPAYISAEGPNNVFVTSTAAIATVMVTPSNGIICLGDSANLSVVTPMQSYLWSTGETTQSINVSQSGSYTVTVTDVLQCITVSDPPSSVTVHECTGVKDISYSEMLNIYPNPFSESATLEIKDYSFGVKGLKIFIYDIYGKEVLKSEIKNPKSEIKRGNLPSGIFFYKIIETDGIFQTGKIIIQ